MALDRNLGGYHMGALGNYNGTNTANVNNLTNLNTDNRGARKRVNNSTGKTPVYSDPISALVGYLGMKEKLDVHFIDLSTKQNVCTSVVARNI